MLDNNLHNSTPNFGTTHLTTNSYSPACIIKRKETVIEGKTQFVYSSRSNIRTNYIDHYFNVFDNVNFDYLIENLLQALINFNLTEILVRYYNDVNRKEYQIPASILRSKVIDIYREVIRKKCESFETEDQKKVFILLFAQQFATFGLSASSYSNDKFVIRNLVKRIKDNTENVLSDYTFENRIDYSRYSFIINTESSSQYRRNPGLTDIKTGNGIKIFSNTVLSKRISFFKKDNNYGILSFCFIDRSKMIYHEENKYSFTYNSWFEYIDYVLRGNVPKHCFTHFFDKDTFLNPSPEHANFIKNLIKRLDPNQEVILGDGLQEFSNNFNYTYLKQFKTLKEKTEFFNKVMKEILDNLKVKDISYLSLEEAKKKVDEYNSVFEQQVEKKEVVILTEEVPANLDELMRFAELMNFEPNEENPVAQEVEYDDDYDDDELSEREMDDVTPIPVHGELIGAIIASGITNLYTSNSSNTQDELVFTPDGNMIISDLPEASTVITTETIREQLNNLINNTNG